MSIQKLLGSIALLLLSVTWSLSVMSFSYRSLPAIANSKVMDEDEDLLVTALIQVHDSNLDGALQTLKRVVDRNPKFRLARLVYGDLLLARGGIIRPFSRRPSLSSPAMKNLLQEARLRLKYRLSPPPRDALPEQLLQMSPSQHYAIAVDVSESRLYVYEQRDGEPVLIGDYYATTGIGGARKQREGDGKTPLGVYFITTRLAQDGLPDLYGAGAFPINYPNEWDLRLGRTGYGIWIHGVPSYTYNRAPKETYGCVAIANKTISDLWDRLGNDTTPVILARKINWIKSTELQIRRSVIQGRLEYWRQDLGSPDPGRYARHYSKDFSASSMDFTAWMRRRQSSAAGQNTGINLSDVSIYSYPGEPNIVVATFNLQRQVNGNATRERIRQYWRHDADDQWRIVYEGAARFKKIHLQGIPPSARAGLARVFR